jgi:tryptophanyl-tRNA synthetase
MSGLPNAARAARVLSGIQPSGVPTLGNYLGALRKWAELSRDGAREERTTRLFMVADLHALTVTPEPDALRESVVGLTASLLACGLDPQRCVLFQQSDVPQHAELSWVLGCHTPMNWLSRMTQYKDKGKGKAEALLGLYAYPSLMAADILLYRATHVPVGEDQQQHLEFSRLLAKRVNSQLRQELFIAPEAVMGDAARVMSLTDGLKKMSKSDPSEGSRIVLTDDADAIRRKVSRAKTDSLGVLALPLRPEERPEVANLVAMLAALRGEPDAQVARALDGANMQVLKAQLTDALVECVVPIGDEIKRIRKDPAYLEGVLAEGAQTAGGIAGDTMRKVKEALGLKAPR